MKKILLFILIFVLYSCNINAKSIDFSESSWICYMQDKDVFYVVSDEWEIQKIDSNLEKIGYFQFDEKYDFEAIVCDEKNNILYTIDEKKWQIYKINSKDDKFNILEKYNINWYKLDEKWIEWFTKISENKYVISTQTKKDNLLIIEFKNNIFKVIQKIDFPYIDLSWLEYKNNNLYIISDKNDKVFIYDLEKEKILREINLDKWAWEWISFDKKWYMFLADDDGRIVKN